MAGAPWNLSQAINAHSEYSSSVIVTIPENDLIMRFSKDLLVYYKDNKYCLKSGL